MSVFAVPTKQQFIGSLLEVLSQNLFHMYIILVFVIHLLVYYVFLVCCFSGGASGVVSDAISLSHIDHRSPV